VFVPARHGMLLKDVKAYIEAHVRANALRIECVASKPMAFDRQNGDRQPHWNCIEATMYIKRGDELSTVAFFSPDVGLARVPIEQHIHFQGYIYTGLNRTYIRTIDAEQEFGTRIYAEPSGMPYGKGCSLAPHTYHSRLITIGVSHSVGAVGTLSTTVLALLCWHLFTSRRALL